MRVLLAALFALLMGALVVRSAAVQASADSAVPSAAQWVWPGHPEFLRSAAMAQVGHAAATGGAPSPAAIDRLKRLAGAEPLAPEPYLVQAAVALRTGDVARAERLLVEARDFAPRSAAARFLLADIYFRTGRIVPGLAEMTVLGRLVPGAMQQLAPSIAAYAADASSAPQLRQLVRRYPELEQPLLNQLAEDPANAELILAIARPGAATDEAPQWQSKLLRKLVEQGEFARAHAVWAKLSGLAVKQSRGLFNPEFRRNRAPAPFDWSLESSGRGVAEPSNGGLRILYFGRDDVALASQTMLLPPGRYRLQMRVDGQIGADSRIGWTIACLPDKRPLLELPLQGRGPGLLTGDFTVPGAGCEAQQIALKGTGREFPRSADFRIAGLELTRLDGR